MSQVLILEDSQVFGNLLARVVQKSGHYVDRVTSLQSAFACLEHRHYDVVVLDRGLPDGDGLEVARFLQAEQAQTRIMVVSGKTELEARLEGFRSGADEYIVKPFDWTEWEYRFKRLLGMRKVKNSQKLQTGTTVFYPETGVLKQGSEQQILRKKEAQVLDCLWRYKNQVVTKDRMVAEIWPNQVTAPSDVTIEVYVRRLRIKLGQEATRIHTFRGLGYMFRDE